MSDGYRALVIYGEESLDMSFLCYHGSVWRNVDMCGEVEVGMAIYGRIRMLRLCLTIHLSLPLV